MTKLRSGTNERGQALVIMVGALVVLMAMAALIVDGGNVYANQRATQNASDAVSLAGSTVLAQSALSVNKGGGPKTDADVLASVTAAAADNRLTLAAAYYTDVAGRMLTSTGDRTTDLAQAVQVGLAPGNAIPPCVNLPGELPTCVVAGATPVAYASGIRALGDRTFSSVLAGVIGLSQFTTSATATSTAGYLELPCDPDSGCAVLPVTFGTHLATCDGGPPAGSSKFEPTEWQAAQGDLTEANEAILAECKNGPGAFGWLDLGAGNLKDQIAVQDHDPIDFPTWLDNKTGIGGAQEELDKYSGNVVGTYEPGLDKIVLIPLFDAICDTLPMPANPDPTFGTPPFPGTCPGIGPGGGTNIAYHIPWFVGFALDKAYIGGSGKECNEPPGLPLAGGGGATGCFKGWFAYILYGPGTVAADPGPAGVLAPLSVQLIK